MERGEVAEIFLQRVYAREKDPRRTAALLPDIPAAEATDIAGGGGPFGMMITLQRENQIRACLVLSHVCVLSHVDKLSVQPVVCSVIRVQLIRCSIDAIIYRVRVIGSLMLICCREFFFKKIKTLFKARFGNRGCAFQTHAYTPSSLQQIKYCARVTTLASKSGCSFWIFVWRRCCIWRVCRQQQCSSVAKRAITLFPSTLSAIRVKAAIIR